ncbi:Ig-like domain-containing protein, partial [Tenacibaculum piscium]|uniref:Ig-like domain-containing protein n=2 Tax=Tenacibaculum piscium TaxID=1458515 RepID=UPI001F176934
MKNNYHLLIKNKLLFTGLLIASLFLMPSLVFGQLSCPNGEIIIEGYAINATKEGASGRIDSPSNTTGTPDGNTSYYSNDFLLVLEYTNELIEGSIITLTGRNELSGASVYPLELEFGTSSNSFSTTTVFAPNFPDNSNPLDEVSVIVPAGFNEGDGYKWIRIKGKGFSGGTQTRGYLDAIHIKTTKCNPCTAGDAPQFSKNPTDPITGQATFDLSTFDTTITNKGIKNVKWYYFLPASVDSEIPNGTQVLSGKYYAVFEGDDNGSPCYSDATEFTIISDFDGDSIIDDIDIDDDNDGILDKFECTTDLTSSGSFEYELSDFKNNNTAWIKDAVDGTKYTTGLDSQLAQDPVVPNTGKKDDWIFHNTVDWTQGQYIYLSDGDAKLHHPSVKQSTTDGGAFIIFSLKDEAVSNQLTGLTIGENYMFSYEMGLLPHYNEDGTLNKYNPSVSVEITNGTILNDNTIDYSTYNASDFPSTVSPTSAVLDPNWKVYKVIFKATSTSVNVKLKTNNSDAVVTVDAVEVIRFPVDPICTQSLNTDADGDGCDDATEAGLTALTPAEIAQGVGVNGLYDALETSVDSGILKDPIDLTTNPYDKDKQGSDCSSSDPCTIGAILGTVTANDPDADGINNVCDSDDDNDGISDTDENINNKNPDADADADGIPLYLDDDDTNAAIGDVNNSIEADFDTDNDGIPNHLDLDADNDGIYDVVEAGGTDTNNDGKADHSGADYSDTAGFPDSTGFGLTPTNTNTITGNPADFLNIDSDGDGCYDANEAYNNANTDTNSDGTYGGVITSAEVNANGLVTGAAYGAPNANYTIVSYINSVCYIDICTEAAGTDTDNDDVNDICDVDIDNDGILNENENCNSPVWGTAPLTWIAKDDSGTITLAGGIDMSIDITTTATGDLDAFGGTALNLSATGTGTFGTLDDLAVLFDPAANQGASPVKIQIDFTEKMYNLNFKITDIDAGGFGFRMDKITITSDVGNPILTKVSETSSSFTVANNQATAIRYVTSDKDNKGTILVQVPDGAKSITIIYEEVGTASDPGVRGIGILGDLKYCLDTDNDGTPDSNDLDSDNDGCPDAVEANENVTSAQLDANKRIDIANQGGVDTNGVPNLVNSGGTADGSNNTQGQGTNTAVLTATKIEVKTQPTNKVICLGGNAVFTAEMLSKSTTIFNAGVADYTGIAGNTTGLVYQWVEQIEGAGSWNVISNGGIYSNATTASLTLTNPPLTTSTNKYRLVTTSTSNTCSEVISDEVLLTVNALPVASITGAVTQPTCAVSTGSFQITGYDSGDTYAFTPSVVGVSGTGLVTANAGSYTFTVTDTDGTGCTSLASSNIVVNAQPNCPPVAQDDSASTTVDALVNVDVLANNGNGLDSDVDGDTLTITDINGTTPVVDTPISVTGGTVTLLSDGTLDIQPDGTGTAITFPYTISDGNGGTDTANVDVTIGNTAPVAQDDSASTTVDALVNVDVLANNGNGLDSDVDGDTLTITDINGTTPVVDTPISVTGGTVTLLSDGTLDIQPDGTGDAITFPYTISDGNGGTDTANVDVTIGNTPPVAQDDTATTAINTLVNVDVLSNNGNGLDSDVDGDTLTITDINGTIPVVDIPISVTGGTVTLLSDGTLDIQPDGTGDAITFPYTISDGNGGNDTANVDVTIGNTPPVAEDDTASTTVDALVNLDVLANNGNGLDSDVDGDTLT